jgi:hypothetical protein
MCQSQWFMSIILASCEAEAQRLVRVAQAKWLQEPILDDKKLGMVAFTSHPSL